MTPKENAEKLVNKFTEPTKVPNVKGIWVEDLDGAKQCALICVDEMIQDRQLTVIGKATHPRTEYWNEVKQEIEKL